MKVKVNAPEYKEFHEKEMYVAWTKSYKNSKNESCTFYYLNSNPPGKDKIAIAQLYLGEKQIIKL